MRPVLLAILLMLTVAGPGHTAETLQQAWTRAMAENAGLLSSQLRADAAQHGVGAAASEGRPSASLRTGYHHLSSQPSFVGSQPGLGGPTFAFPNAQRNAASFSLRASHPLWTGGRIESSVAAAESRRAASSESSQWFAMQLRMAVAESYIAVLKAHASLTAAAESLASANAQAADTAMRASQRRVTDTEVAGARVVVLEAQQRLLTAQNALSNANASYNQLLARPSFAPVELVEPSLVADERSLEEATAFAAATRPDLEEIRRTVRAHEHDAAGWRASLRPQVSVEAGFDYEQNRFRSPQGIGLMGVFVDWSLSDGGKKRRLSSASASKAAAARAVLQDRQSQVAVEVLQAWNRRAEAVGAELVSGEALAHYGELNRLVQQRRSQGLAVTAEAISSQASLAEANARYQHARLNRILAEVRLRFASGTLTPSGSCALQPSRLPQPAPAN